MKLGIVGLPNVGKSTLFNALTQAGAEAQNYPFCTIDPNVGVVPVPDPRLEVLGKLYDTEKIVPAFVEFVDIAGLVKGASKGEGRGNAFLSHIREVDAIVHVVRCFDDEDVIHVDNSVNPARDIDTIETELILADIQSLEKRLEKQQRTMKASKDKKQLDELALMENLLEYLSNNNPARTFSNEEEIMEKIRKDYCLLTSKALIYGANISESELGKGTENAYVKAVRTIAAKEGAEVVVISAKVEAEITQLDDEEKALFLEELGITESGLDSLIKASYKLLGLFSYLTAGKKEVRAWTIVHGTKAPQAAGKIHSDFERGFIKAEVINYHDLVNLGSTAKAKEQGKVRIEGKEYVVQDDDVILFRFNV